jgi:hypothetical protein
MDPDPRVRIPLIPDPDSSLFFSDAKKTKKFLTFLFIAYGTVGIFTSAFKNSKLFSCHLCGPAVYFVLTHGDLQRCEWAFCYSVV